MIFLVFQKYFFVFIKEITGEMFKTLDKYIAIKDGT